MKLVYYLTRKTLKSNSLVKNIYVSEDQRFPVRVRLLAMCRGELSAVIARLMPVEVIERT